MSEANGCDFWQPKDRAIYRYHNGRKVVAADPLRLQDGMAEFEGLELACKMMGSSDGKESLKVAQEVAEHVRKVFGVEEIHREESGAESGLTDQECLELLGHFYQFCAGLKKNADDSPTSSVSSPADSEDNSVIQSSADCFSTDPASIIIVSTK